jgi:hypothetical protein
VTPAGSRPPCGLGQSWNPYPAPYRLAFASSRIFLPASPVPASLTVGLLGAFAPRVIPAYHVSQVVPTDGLRAPLYTGGNCPCVGRPLNSPELAPPPLWGLEPLSRLSSARLTRRNTKASLTFPFPVLPRRRSRVRLTLPTPAVCLRPPRCQ